MRVLIADDHPLVRQGLKQTLVSEASATVVAEAANGDEALRLARNVNWDLAIVDFSMPGKSGLELVAEIKSEFPRKPVLVLSMHGEELHGSRALRSGASGYITKESAPAELANAVRKVAAGGKYVSASLADILAHELGNEANAPHDSLSDREYRVLWLIASGKSMKEISEELGVGASTVSTFRSRVLRKLRLSSNADLVRYALRHSLVQ